MNPLYPSVSLRAGHRCEYCHAPEVIFNFPFEVEHIDPVSQGGEDETYNLALACHSCNLFKSDHRTGVDELTQPDERLYHPRVDQWEEHFQVDVETGAILGKTPVGRATVDRLRMNSEGQLTARLLWIRLKLFP